MAQPTEVYVDPALAGDSGTGTISDPYGDLEYAIEQTTFDTTNGTRVNVKAGTDEILAADISTAMADVATTPAWAPATTAPMIIQGYTATAGDGGKGGISGNGATSIFNSSSQGNVHLIDLHLHNTAGNVLVDIGTQCMILRCEINNATGTGVNVDIESFSHMIGCYIHDHAGSNRVQGTGVVCNNWLANGTNKFTSALYTGSGRAVFRNIIVVDGSTVGIQLAGQSMVWNNSIYCTDAGTGAGIDADNSVLQAFVCNNLVEGFSGAGGRGIKFETTHAVQLYFGNAAFDNTTDFDEVYDWVGDQGDGGWGDNESLASSPFNNAAGLDFTPVNVGNVRGGSLPDNFGDDQQ